MTDKKTVYQLKIEAQKKKMEILTGKEKNLKSYRNLRREIAKILTQEKESQILKELEGVKTK